VRGDGGHRVMLASVRPRARRLFPARFRRQAAACGAGRPECHV
jgi:hypothetical protein